MDLIVFLMFLKLCPFLGVIQKLSKINILYSASYVFKFKFKKRNTQF